MNVRMLVVCAGLLFLPALGMGQSVDVVLKGVVTDESGAVVPGATVTATNLETGLVRSATADPSGHYILLNLPAGMYDVRAELTGLAPQVRRAQTFYVGTTITLDFTLEVAGVPGRVEVRRRRARARSEQEHALATGSEERNRHAASHHPRVHRSGGVGAGRDEYRRVRRRRHQRQP